jgi:hypothetical protein
VRVCIELLIAVDCPVRAAILGPLIIELSQCLEQLRAVPNVPASSAVQPWLSDIDHRFDCRDLFQHRVHSLWDAQSAIRVLIGFNRKWPQETAR